MSDQTTPPEDPETPENGGGGGAGLPDGIEAISIESELRSSYLDYAMSVIVSRALPDVRDGLKHAGQAVQEIGQYRRRRDG